MKIYVLVLDSFLMSTFELVYAEIYNLFKIKFINNQAV